MTERPPAMEKGERDTTTGQRSAMVGLPRQSHSPEGKPALNHGGTFVEEDPSPPAEGKPTEVDADEAAAMLNRASIEFINGRFGQAIELAKSVTRLNPTRAWRIIGAAACSQKDLRLANEAFKHLDSAGRQYLIYACASQKIGTTGVNKFQVSK